MFAPDGRTAYAVSTGANSVSAFAVDGRGGLRPLGTPVATGGEFAFSIAIAPGGRSLYVSNADSGTVSAFGIDSDGTARLLGAPVPSGAGDSRGLAVSRDGRFLFVGHGRPNAAATDMVTTFAIGRDGTLRPVGEPVAGGGAGTGMTTSPDGRFLYVVSTNADAVFGYAIRRTGALDQLPGSPFPAADFPEGVAMAPDGRHLYVTSPGPDRAHRGHSVSAFTVGADGVLTPVAGSPFTAGVGPVGVAVSIDSRHLYVGNFDDSTLSAFTIIPGGALREVSGSPFPTGGTAPAFQSVAVLPARH
ncbi:MAG: lactonase family protein [Actinomadura sp.]